MNLSRFTSREWQIDQQINHEIGLLIETGSRDMSALHHLTAERARLMRPVRKQRTLP